MLQARRHVRAQFFGHGRSIGQPEPIEKARAETAVGDALRAQEAAVEARTGFGDVQNLQEQVFEALISADRAPLDLVLIDVGLKAEEFADPPVKIADGIGRILFVLEREMRAARLPARAAAEIAAAIEREDGGLFERGRIVGGSGVRQVMLQDDDAAVGKLGAQLQVKVRFGNGTDHGHGVHLLGLRPGQLQTGGDGMLRHFVEAAPVGAAPDQLRFFDGGSQFAVLEYRGGGIAQQAADS